MGFCFDCAQAESIINDGTDMFDVPIERENQLKSSSAEMNKVKFLIQKGWKPPERKLNSTTGLKRKLRGGA
jgi:hypothetical protein